MSGSLQAEGYAGREMAAVRLAVEGVKEELAALRACLEMSGHLRSGQLSALLHRRRFEVTLRRHPCSFDAAFTDVVHDPGVLHPVLRFAGAPALRHVAACAPALRHSTEVSQQYAVRPARIYFLGGSPDEGPPLDSATCFDVERGHWEELPPMPTARDVLAAAAVGCRIYAVGGKDGQRAYAATECYDAELRRWSHCSPMAVARGGLGAAAASDLVYAVGGSDGLRALSVVECYNPEANAWSRAFSLLTPRRGVAVAASGGRLYAVGGTDGSEVLSSVECLNTVGGVPWSPLPPMLRARRAASAAAVNGRICVVGGAGGLGHLEGCIEVAECFDPDRCLWEALPSMSQARRGLALLAVDSLLFAFGGSDGEQTLGTVEVFDSFQHKWEPRPSMPSRRGYFGAAQTQTLEVLGLSVGPALRGNFREALRQSISAQPNLPVPPLPEFPAEPLADGFGPTSLQSPSPGTSPAPSPPPSHSPSHAPSLAASFSGASAPGRECW